MMTSQGDIIKETSIALCLSPVVRSSQEIILGSQEIVLQLLV